MVAIPKERTELIIKEKESFYVKYHLHPDQRWSIRPDKSGGYSLMKGKSGQIVLSEDLLNKYFYMEEE